MQKNTLHNNAESKTITSLFLGYADLARELEIEEQKLRKRLFEYNKKAPSQGWATIQPDEKEGSHYKHLYRRERLPEFVAMLQAMSLNRKPGRPHKTKD